MGRVNSLNFALNYFLSLLPPREDEPEEEEPLSRLREPPLDGCEAAGAVREPPEDDGLEAAGALPPRLPPEEGV